MTKTEHEKLLKRLDGYMFPGNRCHLAHIIAREVDRAVRAERKAQRDTEELWASHRRRADEQLIERAQNIGRKSK